MKYSYEWINGQKPHLTKNGIRIPCSTENFVPIVVPGLSSSSSGSSSTSKTPSRQESHSSSSSSTSFSTPTVSEIQTREREDRTESDISPVHVSTMVDDRSGQPDETSFLSWFQACQIRLLDLTHQLQGHFQDRRVNAQHLLPARLHHLQQVKFKTREREDRIESDISPVIVSTYGWWAIRATRYWPSQWKSKTK